MPTRVIFFESWCSPDCLSLRNTTGYRKSWFYVTSLNAPEKLRLRNKVENTLSFYIFTYSNILAEDLPLCPPRCLKIILCSIFYEF